MTERDIATLGQPVVPREDGVAKSDPAATQDRWRRNRDRAFNAGSDARIAGLPLTHNPYDVRTHPRLRDEWRRGWEDAHYFFPAAKLPPVRE